MKLYVNGVLVQTGKETSGKNSNDARFTKVILGADNDLSPLINDHYHVHIDDFAVWLTDLPEAEIAYIMKQGKDKSLFWAITIINCLSCLSSSESITLFHHILLKTSFFR